jgi:hypothetical protein
MMETKQPLELGGGPYILYDPCSDYVLSLLDMRYAKLVIKALAPEGSVPHGREATTAEFYLPLALVRRLKDDLVKLLVTVDELQNRSDEAARAGQTNVSPIRVRDTE